MNLKRLNIKEFCETFNHITVGSSGVEEAINNSLSLVLRDYFEKFSKEEMESMGNLVQKCVNFRQLLLIDEILKKDACYNQFTKVGQWLIDFSKKHNAENDFNFSYMVYLSCDNRLSYDKNKKNFNNEELSALFDVFNRYASQKGQLRDELIDEILKEFPSAISFVRESVKGCSTDLAEMYVRACNKIGGDVLDGILDSYLPSYKEGARFFISALNTPTMNMLSKMGATFTGANYSYGEKSLVSCLADSGREDLINLIPSVKDISTKNEEPQEQSINNLNDKFSHVKSFYKYMKMKSVVKSEIEIKNNGIKNKI